MIRFISSKLVSALTHYGGWGLFGISFLDSSILSFPLVNDLLLMHLSSSNHLRMPFYVLGSTMGSLAGSYFLYFLARAGLDLIAGKKRSRKSEFMRRRLKQNEIVAGTIVALLPPPAPYKAFPIGAGILKVSPLRFGLGLLIGRLARYSVEGYIGVHYGVRAEVFLRKNIVPVSVVLLALVAALAVGYRIRSRSAGSQ